MSDTYNDWPTKCQYRSATTGKIKTKERRGEEAKEDEMTCLPNEKKEVLTQGGGHSTRRQWQHIFEGVNGGGGDTRWGPQEPCYCREEKKKVEEERKRGQLVQFSGIET